jgi:choloylglycine hydrolase
VAEDYPLYYEAANECGLSMAGLNFPGNAFYFPEIEGKDNIAPFEFIPWILTQCKDLKEVRGLLEKINLCDISFNEAFPLSPLHWIIADRDGAITVESVKDGLRIYENPVGVLTNNPTFDYHLLHLCDYMNLTSEAPENRFANNLTLQAYSNGMGAMGLPGDFSSASRFVRAVFVMQHSPAEETEQRSVHQFFHILSSVAMPRGSVLVHGKYEITRYSCCCNTTRGIYYYTTYDNCRITGIDMHRENLDGDAPTLFPLVTAPQILMQNQAKDGTGL